MVGQVRHNAEEWFKELRGKLVSTLEEHESVQFKEKKWNHAGKGGGLMSIIKGDLIEKGGVPLGVVYQDTTRPSLGKRLASVREKNQAKNAEALLNSFSI